MDDMIDYAVNAVLENLNDKKKHGHVFVGEIDNGRVMIDGLVNLGTVVRAVLMSIREPMFGVGSAGARAADLWRDSGCDDATLSNFIWEDMIYAALNGGEK